MRKGKKGIRQKSKKENSESQRSRKPNVKNQADKSTNGSRKGENQIDKKSNDKNVNVTKIQKTTGQNVIKSNGEKKVNALFNRLCCVWLECVR